MPHTWHDVMLSGKSCAAVSFQSTCHIRGMTNVPLLSFQIVFISIHMPHMWHDLLRTTAGNDAVNISIHMPHTWHDLTMPKSATAKSAFQSTCHIRGMTTEPESTVLGWLFQSTCHIRGMTCGSTLKVFIPCDFNPHATYVA